MQHFMKVKCCMMVQSHFFSEEFHHYKVLHISTGLLFSASASGGITIFASTEEGHQCITVDDAVVTEI